MNPSLTILDVGHGSCVFVRDGVISTLIDCRDATLFIEYLESIGVDEINQIIVTHSDADHIAGISAVIQSDFIQVGVVYINSDAAKNTVGWQELKIALQDAYTRKGLRVEAASVCCQIKSDSVTFQIVAPGIAWLLTGAGGLMPDGTAVTTNGMSVVLRLYHEGHPVALLPGDMGRDSLDDIISRNEDISADLLIFPHHGGYVSEKGSSHVKECELDAFTGNLMRLVTPKIVLFSTGRGVHSTPRPIILERIRDYSSTCGIRCTQMSKHCQDDPVPKSNVHLSSLPSRGRSSNKCCGGSIEIQFAGIDTVGLIDMAEHSRFVNSLSGAPLCIRSF